MTSRPGGSHRIFPLIITLSLVLTASLLFGQVMGSLYLENLTAFRQENRSPRQIGREEGKTKVLRLKIIPYYTIEAAGYKEREKALQLGKTLAGYGFPVIVTGSSPHRVRLGFLNNEEKLLPLAWTITVDGRKAVVKKDEINLVSFRFAGSDKFAAEQIAPFIGDISICLEKALLINSDLDTAASDISRLKGKFPELAGDIEALSKKGAELSAQASGTAYAAYLSGLTMSLSNWAAALNRLGTDWSDAQLLGSQQQALAVLEEYQRLINSTN